MQICCDETGKFILEPGYPQENVFPCVCAIAFPNQGAEEWNRSYSSLIKGMKGKMMKNAQAEELIAFLADIGARAFLISTNFQQVSEKVIGDERIGYLLSAENACKEQPQHLQEAVSGHVEILRGLSLPDYVKAKLIIKLMENTIKGIVGNTRYYSDEDLSSFTWYCDLVSEKIHRTVRHFVHYQLNCYSQSEPFYVEEVSRLSPFINIAESRKYLDTSKILQQINFKKDEDVPGIKAADCIANFFPRLLRGTLTLGNFGGLMKLFSLPHSLDFIHFDHDKPMIDVPISSYGRSVLDALEIAEKWGRAIQFVHKNPIIS